jgi:hypothetical protein
VTLPDRITVVAVRLTTDIGSDATVGRCVEPVSTIIDGSMQGAMDLQIATLVIPASAQNVIKFQLDFVKIDTVSNKS